MSILHKAVNELAARCDGAESLDGAGFNKPDSSMGKILAAVPYQDWSDVNRRQAWLMLQKYRKQLGGYGVDLAEAEEPPALESERAIGWSASKKKFVVVFPFSHEEKETVKATFPSAEFDYKGSRQWYLSVAESDKVMGFAQANGYCVTEGALGAIADPEPYLPKRENEYQVKSVGNCFQIKFPKHERGIMDEVRAIDGRYWNREATAWDVPHRQVHHVKVLTEKYQFFVTAEAQAGLDGEAGPLPDKRVEVDEGVFLFWYPFSYETNDRLKERVPGLKARKVPEFVWTAPLSSAVEVQVFAEANGFTVMPEAKRVIEEHVARIRENIAGSGAYDAEFEIEGLNGQPFPYQVAGVKYAVENKRVLVADQMGLGKTLQALATVHVLQAYPCVVICPASLKVNWQREVAHWLPDGVSTEIVYGSKAKHNADITIINYDIIGRHREAIIRRGIKALVCDESHYLRNYAAQRTLYIAGQKENKSKGKKRIVGVAEGVEVRLLLSGTPIVNKPKELISQLQVLDRLDDLGGFWGFTKRYCRQTNQWAKNGYDLEGAMNLEELNRKLRANCYIRREKNQVLKELPPKRREPVVIELDNRAKYKKAEKDLIKYLKEQVTEDKAFYRSLGGLSKEEREAAVRLRQNEIAESAERAKHLVEIEKLKQLAVEGKMAGVIEWVQNVLDSGEKLVLFATHTEIIKKLAKHFNAPSIHGGTSDANRTAAKDKFQDDPECRLIVGNIQAMGVGLTLTAASDVAFVELGWTPGEHDQAEDRCHRIGQEGSVTAWYLLAEGTIDERIARLIERKRSVVETATIGEAVGRKESGSILGDLLKELAE